MEHDDGHALTASSKTLVFFAVPVVAGFMFENGATYTMDVILIALAALMLYWSIETPWQWYQYARRLSVDEWSEYHASDDAIYEESEEGEDGANGVYDEDAGTSSSKKSGPKSEDVDSKEEGFEWHTLRAYEVLSLASCFVSPALTSYALHEARQYLARPAGSPVENASFLLFVIAAELRPMRQVCKLLFAHTLYLQRVVTSYDVLEDNKLTTMTDDLKKQREEMAELKNRLENLLPVSNGSPPIMVETQPNRTPPSSDVDSKVVTIQTQVNALNRAVRQYEKRAITQQLAVEGRLRGLEARINDSLTLAAAATRTNQKQNLVWDFLTSLLLFPIHLLQTIFTWPLTMLSQCYRFLLGPRRKKRKSRSKPRYDPDFASRGRMEDR